MSEDHREEGKRNSEKPATFPPNHSVQADTSATVMNGSKYRDKDKEHQSVSKPPIRKPQPTSPAIAIRKITARKGRPPGRRLLRGKGLILKKVEGAHGHFSRIGILEFKDFGEWIIEQIEDMFIRNAEVVGSKNYDPSLGHLITLV